MTSSHDSLTRQALGQLSREKLLAFLSQRRWFAAKGQTPLDARVSAVIPVFAPDEHYAIVVVDVELADAVHRYHVPLVVRQPGELADATEDERFRVRLAEALQHGARYTGVDGEFILEPIAASTRPASLGTRPSAESRVSSAEQSNTSIIYGDSAILKLFRRLEAGESPDVEISRFLTTRTAFPNVPALLGVMRLTSKGQSMVAGMMSEYLPGSTDAWSHALTRIREYLQAGRNTEPANPFAAEMTELGRVTRALHEALASHPEEPGFSATPVTDEDLSAWGDAARKSVTTGLDLLESQLRAGHLKGQSLAIADATIKRRAGALARITEVLADPRSARDPGRKTRHHGDYHLGQVLRTREGKWMVIDFEGEPSRSLEERRAPNSPLRDVAGMLRSFAYAAASGAMETGGLGRDSVVEMRTARWERAARSSFLEGYLEASATDKTPVPASDRDYVDSVITLFEIEKVFYELAYELNNRPDWVWIPLRGIAKLF